MKAMQSLGGAVAFVCLGAAFAQSPVQLVKFAGGFSQPTHIADPGDGSGRLFVVEQQGRIRVISNGTVLPFLDITDRVLCCGERGLLSVAFPPGQPRPEFYVYYTDMVGDITISRFMMNAARDAGDPASETVILTIDHRQFNNHNGGQLVFGPDGFLWAGTGDGGGGGDPLGNAQNKNSLLGKLLRIDVAHASTTPLMWAYGLRNPWRFSFDRATHDLYIADVGQNLYEEVDFQPASGGPGLNYGWPIMEGFHCYQPDCSSAGLVLPVAEYSHGAGDCAITGGFVYRGAQYPSLQGTYFYADYCTGHFWGLTHQGGSWNSMLLLTTGLAISSFGEDAAGELYLADQGKGDIYRITGTTLAAQITAVVDAASFAPGISPGSLASIFGQGITSVTGVVNADGTPLPLTLGGASVLVNGVAAPLLAVADVNGQEQINFQVPFETPPLGAGSIVVKNGSSPDVTAQAELAPVHPALFTTDGTHAAAQHGADYTPVTSASPATAGEVILLYGTGLGPVGNPPATGAAAHVSPLSTTATTPGMTIGSAASFVEFAGLTPMAVGLYQINVRVPAGQAAGEQDVIVTIDGQSSKPVKIFVR
jgi:uncharacterized protein (TIGR03437 family)